MEDFGDYIYLIIIVIAGLSSLLKKRRKPEEHSGRKENRMPDLDDVLSDDDDDFLPRMDRSPVPAPVANPEVYVRKEYTTMVPNPEQAPHKYETIADYMKLKVKRTVRPVHYDAMYDDMLQPDDQPDLQIDLETADDAKRAFVYAEIFNRKY